MTGQHYMLPFSFLVKMEVAAVSWLGPCEVVDGRGTQQGSIEVGNMFLIPEGKKWRLAQKIWPFTWLGLLWIRVGSEQELRQGWDKETEQ